MIQTKTYVEYTFMIYEVYNVQRKTVKSYPPGMKNSYPQTKQEVLYSDTEIKNIMTFLLM